MDPRSYNHRTRADLQALAQDLESLTPQQRTLATIYSIGAKLMNAPIGLRTALGLVTLRHGKAEGVIMFADNLTRRSPGTAAELWQGLVQHMLHGKDTYDARSAGGWNKQELDRFMEFVQAMGWQPPDVALTAGQTPEPPTTGGPTPSR